MSITLSQDHQFSVNKIITNNNHSTYSTALFATVECLDELGLKVENMERYTTKIELRKIVTEQEDVYIGKSIDYLYNNDEIFKNKLCELSCSEIMNSSDQIFPQYTTILSEYKKNKCPPASSKSTPTSSDKNLAAVILDAFLKSQKLQHRKSELSSHQRNILTSRLKKLYTTSLPSEIKMFIDKYVKFSLDNEVSVSYRPTSPLSIDGKSYINIEDYVNHNMKTAYTDVCSKLTTSISKIIKYRIFNEVGFSTSLINTGSEKFTPSDNEDVMEHINIKLLEHFRKLLSDRVEYQDNIHINDFENYKNLIALILKVKMIIPKYALNDDNVSYILKSFFTFSNFIYVVPQPPDISLKSFNEPYPELHGVNPNVIWKYVRCINIINHTLYKDQGDIECTKQCVNASISNVSNLLKSIKLYCENQVIVSTLDKIKQGRTVMYVSDNKESIDAQNALTNEKYSFDRHEVTLSTYSQVIKSQESCGVPSNYTTTPIIIVDNQFIGGWNRLKEYLEFKPKNSTNFGVADYNIILKILTNDNEITLNESGDLNAILEQKADNNTDVKQRIYNYSLYK